MSEPCSCPLCGAAAWKDRFIIAGDEVTVITCPCVPEDGPPVLVNVPSDVDGRGENEKGS